MEKERGGVEKKEENAAGSCTTPFTLPFLNVGHGRLNHGVARHQRETRDLPVSRIDSALIRLVVETFGSIVGLAWRAYISRKEAIGSGASGILRSE